MNEGAKNHTEKNTESINKIRFTCCHYCGSYDLQALTYSRVFSCDLVENQVKSLDTFFFLRIIYIFTLILFVLVNFLTF